MGLATKFKAAIVGTGIALSALGTMGMSAELQREAALERQGYVQPVVRAEIELNKSHDTVVFLTGTTLVAAGLRRKKTP